MHLFSGVHLQDLPDFCLRKYKDLIFVMLFLNLKSSVPKSTHVSVAISISLLLL